MEAKNTQLQQRTLQLNRQLMEVQTLRVRKWIFYCIGNIMTLSTRALVIRRTKEGCRQKWRLRMLRLTGNRENCKH